MIRTLSSRFVLAATGLAAMCGSLVSHAQFPATITTAYTATTTPPAATYSFAIGYTPPQYVTFVVKNTNTFPIKITEVGNLITESLKLKKSAVPISSIFCFKKDNC